MSDHTTPLPAPFADWPRPFAFALSGAGAFGSAQVGMLRALRERGIVPDLVVGTSAGALHGALLAAEPSTAVDKLHELWLSVDRQMIFGNRRHAAISLLRNRSISSGDRLSALIGDHLPTDDFDDLHVPFAAVATDALTGEPELLLDGSLRSALMASAAVPGLFPRVSIHGRDYVDGGVAANVPIRQAIAFGARSVLSLDATPPTIASSVPHGFLGSISHSASLMLRNQRSHAVDELAHRYRIAVMPSATPPDMGTFNFDHTADLLERSYRTASDTLDAWVADSISSDHRPN